MPQSITQYNLLISCPGDIQSEIKLIEQAVEDFNDHYTDYLGISIRTKHWKKSSYTQSGGKPQTLLNEQIVEKCDAAVALFWTRFGTPTDEYGSGTEEEIEIMLNSGKQVFMYFSDKPMKPSQQNVDEYKRVKAFQEKYKDKGIYTVYTSDEDFSKKFFADLSLYFLSQKSIAELKETRSPMLLLRGIDEKGRLCDNAVIHPFILNSNTSMNAYQVQIERLLHTIAEMYVGKRNCVTNDDPLVTPFSELSLSLYSYKPAEISEEQQKIVSLAAKKFHFMLPSDFFSLGNLLEDKGPMLSIHNKTTLLGTENEKKKFSLIQELCSAISDLTHWAPIETAFSDIPCVKFAIENTGTAIDEDIEITIRFDKQTLMRTSEFPPLDCAAIEFLVKEYNIPHLFCILDTVQYRDYESTTSKEFTPPDITEDLLYGRDFEKEYKESLYDAFCYDFYSDENSYILKLKFNYIKHHTAVAFPTPILLKGIPTKIAYEITSKNTADIISGSITVENNNSFLDRAE